MQTSTYARYQALTYSCSEIFKVLYFHYSTVQSSIFKEIWLFDEAFWQLTLLAYCSELIVNGLKP